MFIKVSTENSANIIINTTNISSINSRVIKMNNGDILELEQESLHELLMNLSPKEKQVKNHEPKPELLELFEKLHKLTGGKGRVVFSLGREKKLNDLLTKHRMTPDLLITAATNIGKNDFLQGANDGNGGKGERYGNIDYLLRPDKAAKWSEDQAEKKKSMF